MVLVAGRFESLASRQTNASATDLSSCKELGAKIFGMRPNFEKDEFVISLSLSVFVRRSTV